MQELGLLQGRRHAFVATREHILLLCPLSLLVRVLAVGLGLTRHLGQHFVQAAPLELGQV
jgi:hypothetical protein